jgi:hypothetical protein
MATNESKEVFDFTFPANADLSAKQFQPVKLVTGGKVDACSAAADRAIGILQNAPTSGHAATVRILGVSKGVSDGSGTAIAVGDLVGTNASGVLVQKATSLYSALGYALTTSAASGTIISVLLLPGINPGTPGG